MVLAALQKPVSVTAFPALAALAIAPYPHERSSVEAKRLREDANWHEQQFGPAGRVQLRGHRTSLVLTLPELARWREQYYLNIISWWMDDVDDEAADAGAQAVLRFAPPGEPGEDVLAEWGE